MPAERLKIACVQMDMRLGDADYNFAHAQEPAEEEPEEEEPEEEERPEDGEMVSVREEVFLQAEEDLAPATVRKARVFPLILYIILSIPITLLGVVLLLIPTLLSLSFAVTFVVFITHWCSSNIIVWRH